MREGTLSSPNKHARSAEVNHGTKRKSRKLGVRTSSLASVQWRCKGDWRCSEREEREEHAGAGEGVERKVREVEEVEGWRDWRAGAGGGCSRAQRVETAQTRVTTKRTKEGEKRERASDEEKEIDSRKREGLLPRKVLGSNRKFGSPCEWKTPLRRRRVLQEVSGRTCEERSRPCPPLPAPSLRPLCPPCKHSTRACPGDARPTVARQGMNRREGELRRRGRRRRGGGGSGRPSQLCELSAPADHYPALS